LCLAAVGAAILTYLPFLSLPFISDDYTQLFLSRQYGPVSGWGALSQDVLYRSRATSLLVTHAVDLVFGASATAHSAASLLLHALNVCLIAAMGRWHRIGWRTSVMAAFIFGVTAVHQEAVVWNAALPELLVFTFGLLSFLAWIHWLERGRALWCGLAIVCYLLALLSKESAVVFLPALAVAGWFSDRRKQQAGILVLLICASTVYTALIFAAAPHHLHLNDGTFSAHAPFVGTILRSGARILWPAGFLALIAIAAARGQAQLVRTAWALSWIATALGPYAFLTYMPRVPSRHTYLAVLGLAFLIAWGLQSIRSRFPGLPRNVIAAFIAVYFVANGLDLWLRKLPQYERRAAASERFLEFARSHPGPIVIQCSPYSVAALEHSAVIRLGWSEGQLTAQPPVLPAGVYCDTDKP